MGTQGLRISAVGSGLAARRGHQARASLIISSLAIIPALAGCSSWSNPYATASAPSPPNASAPRYAAGATPIAAAAPADADLAANAYPYPKQSLFDNFRGSTESAQPSVPHPPSTYTPVNQPYSPPPAQPAYGGPAGAAPAAAAPAANTDPSGYPYPKQSLFDAFSNKPAGQ